MSSEQAFPQIVVLKPSGILDSTQTKKLRSDIDAVLNSSTKAVLIDLENVTFMDSSGLGALVIILKSVRMSGGKLYICSMNSQIQMLFELTGMHKVFDTFENQSEFYQAVKTS
ncbi:STAS domain-containing protein [Oscillatoria sp. FACHB-1407]|uniref:STAS domain-containing protein n=1 Tax=Oscillatoria sp. FACHB-1407 TaxID=2692847 RepID=UPI001685050C|nr:STAS domain-containing protein [Oscillatoria sp. FACHB-1407]MBD2461124.1 STAS domain-containing protein [Oscillatoria sp. FACHB-1407]